MQELLQQIADQTGVPVDMLERAARARAGATGATPEAIVAEWAGAPVPAGGDDAAAPSAPAPAASVAPEPIPVGETADAPEALSVEVLEPEAPVAEERETEPEPVAAGPAVPGWLSAAFLVVPFIAVLYALSVPNGPDCGNAGRLAIDPVTGVAVNCDGSEFGAEEANFFAMGEEIFASRCAACHGALGGGAAGPALSGGAVVATFSQCSDHVKWVDLGSLGWPESTYGDSGKAVTSGMPAFGPILDDEQALRAVVLYERVNFGGQDLPTAEVECGLVEPEVEALGQ